MANKQDKVGKAPAKIAEFIDSGKSESVMLETLAKSGDSTINSGIENRLHWRVTVNQNVITVNSAIDKSSKPRLSIIDLDLYGLIPPGTTYRSGVYYKCVPISEFPHYRAVVIELINNLARKHEQYFKGSGRRSVTNVLRWLHFFSMRGKYRLRDVTSSDIEYAINNLERGFFSLLDIDGKCKGIIHHLRGASADNISHGITLKSTVLPALQIAKGFTSTLLAFPWEGSKSPLPQSYRNGLRDLYCAQHPDMNGATPPKGPEPVAASKDSLIQFFIALNHLNHFIGNTDRIPFLPVYDVNRTAAQLATRKTDERTPNVSLEDAIKMLETATTWIYDFGPTIVRLATDYRLALERRWTHLKEVGARSANDSSNEQDLILILINECDKARADGKFPDVEICTANNRPRGDQRKTAGMYKFRDIVDTLMTACFVVIALCNARRKNEVSGEHNEYGLYYGCVEKVDAVLSYATIEFYIEKTLQEYRTFSTNQLTVDAVSLLEDLYWVFEPFGNNRQRPSRVKAEEERKRKLFTFCRLTKYSLRPESHKRHPFLFGVHSALFFELANVEAQKLATRTHIFRRLFSLIYLYRFKDARLEALSQHLCHLDYASTMVYVTDPETRGEAESIERLYRLCKTENAHTEEEMEAVRLIFSRETIKEMIEGNTAGGMANRVRKLHRRMLKSVKPVRGKSRYSHLTDQEKITFLVDVYKTHQQIPEPRKHGLCWADIHHNGQCRDKETGKLAREYATPKKCSACAYHSFSSEFIANLEADLAALIEDGKNFYLPTAQRLGAKKAASNLRALINLEYAMLEESTPL